MLSYRVPCDAPATVAWKLYATPRRWKEWAPHVRSPRGLGEGEVQAGAKGSVRLAGAVPVPVAITAVEPGRSWSWRVGPALLHHRVEPATDRASGCEVVLEIEAPFEPALRLSYGPVCRALIGNLARVARRESER